MILFPLRRRRQRHVVQDLQQGALTLRRERADLRDHPPRRLARHARHKRLVQRTRRQAGGAPPEQIVQRHIEKVRQRRQLLDVREVRTVFIIGDGAGRDEEDPCQRLLRQTSVLP